jgi:hypothetical protein
MTKSLSGLLLFALAAAGLWMASANGALAQRHAGPACTFQKCFDRCIQNGGVGRGGSSRNTSACGNMCRRRCQG